MIIYGRRRGGAKQLSDHLLKVDEEAAKVKDFSFHGKNFDPSIEAVRDRSEEGNERVRVVAIEGFSFSTLSGENLKKALKQMEAVGFGKDDNKNLYHAIFAPSYGENLTPAQVKFMAEYYCVRLGLEGHQFAGVEHIKHGKQHFHFVFNLTHPETGKTARMGFDGLKNLDISRELETIFGLKPPTPKGKASRTWETQRAKRTGIDTLKMKKEVTAIFNKATNAVEFVSELKKAGYHIALHNNGSFVLIDKYGDIHGLLRRIEGANLVHLKRRFPDLYKMNIEDADSLSKKLKPTREPKPIKEPKKIDPQKVKEDAQMHYQNSKTGAEFIGRLRGAGYQMGRGLNGFKVIDENGTAYTFTELLGKRAANDIYDRFPDLKAFKPRPASEIIRRLKVRFPRKNIKRDWKEAAGASARPITYKAANNNRAGGGKTTTSLFTMAALWLLLRKSQKQRDEAATDDMQPLRNGARRRGSNNKLQNFVRPETKDLDLLLKSAIAGIDADFIALIAAVRSNQLMTPEEIKERVRQLVCDWKATVKRKKDEIRAAKKRETDKQKGKAKEKKPF